MMVLDQKEKLFFLEVGRETPIEPVNWDELFLDIYPRLKSFFLKRLMADSQTAEDCAQETLLHLFKAILNGKFDIRRPLMPYAYAIAMRVAYDFWGKKASAISDVSLEQYENVGREDGKLNSVENTNNFLILFDKAGLTNQQKTIVLLMTLYDCRPREVAFILGKSNLSVRRSLHLARMKMRKVVLDALD